MTCCDHDCHAPNTDTRYRQILWAALGVNVAMFFVEIAASFIAGSVSLRADALDFLGDAANYAVALAVVGLSLQWRAGAALLKGSVMGLFGLWVAASTIHNAIAAAVPKAELMGTIGLLALAANLSVAGLALPVSAGRQPGDVGLAMHTQRLHRQHRGYAGRSRCMGIRYRMAGYRRGRDHRLSRP